MHSFTKEQKEQLERILQDAVSYEDNAIYIQITEESIKIIDNYDNEIKKEIGNYVTGIAFGDDFFLQQESVTKEDLLPLVSAIANEFDGIIKESGLYKFTINLAKIK